jgi:class 3 adenylate cyclase
MLRLGSREPGITAERGYDEGTLRKVAALAARLQSRQQETLTAREIEAIAAEAGLEPGFIQQALAQLAAEQPPARRKRAAATEFWSLVAAYGILLLWTTLAVLWSSDTRGWVSDVFNVLALYGVVPLALLLGFLVGRSRAGFAISACLILAMTPACLNYSFHYLSRTHPSDPIGIGAALVTAGLYAVLGAPLIGWVGLQGARAREHCLPLPSAKLPVSRPALLNLLFSLQRQLEGQKERRAFLSVDVVGSSEMKRSAPELAVEHSFGQYRGWIEDVVCAHGGEMQSAAGDGVMAIFPADAGAVRAARQLQEELPRFNQEQNRLPLPFRIRCGVSAGEVAIEEGTPLGHLQSPVIDRAAVLQKRAEPGEIVVSAEVAGAALVELGALAPVPEPAAGEPAFSWRAETPSLST